MHGCVRCCMHKHACPFCVYACTTHSIACACMRTHTHTYLPTDLPICIHKYIPTNLHTYTHAYMHACMHTYIHTYTHTLHTLGQRDRRTDGQNICSSSQDIPGLGSTCIPGEPRPRSAACWPPSSGTAWPRHETIPSNPRSF